MFCPKCGEPQQKRNFKTCTACGYELPPSAQPVQNLEGILPVNTSGWAIAAGYLGLFAVLGVPAPFAAICGVVALVKIRAEPGLRGQVRAWLGILLGAGFSAMYLILIVMSALHK